MQSPGTDLLLDSEDRVALLKMRIEKFKKDSLPKVNLISQDIVSNLIKDIFGEELNKSSIEASVSQTIKQYEKDK